MWIRFLWRGYESDCGFSSKLSLAYPLDRKAEYFVRTQWRSGLMVVQCLGHLTFRMRPSSIAGNSIA